MILDPLHMLLANCVYQWHVSEINFHGFLKMLADSCAKHVQVREIVAVLDLDVLFYPCPQNGPTFRPKVVQMGGKQQFPYMVCHFSFYYCSPDTTCT